MPEMPASFRDRVTIFILYIRHLKFELNDHFVHLLGVEPLTHAHRKKITAKFRIYLPKLACRGR